ncbi:MAG: hypothetical protein J6P60_07065 [Lachnospiraceae bacterium]|nr:hypothetical protein [Lachnospiraceae bacterium]
MVVRITEKIILILLMTLFVRDQTTTAMQGVVCILISVIFMAFLEIRREERSAFLIAALSAGLTLWQRKMNMTIPVALYGLFSSREAALVQSRLVKAFQNKPRRVADNGRNMQDNSLALREKIRLVLMAVIAVILCGIAFAQQSVRGTQLVCVMLLAVYLPVRSSLAQETILERRTQYDHARMEMLRAKQSRERTIRQSEDDIYMATLRERNRIAREIHDNVGHMLTRAIVQMQAVRIINKDEALTPHLESVDDTINQAMSSIRRSVHELHDESIDLSIMVNEIVKTLPECFSVSCNTSIESAIGAKVKSTILGIVREAVTNIARHSSGSEVKVEIIEHAAFWRIYVHDNGVNPKRDYVRDQIREDESGMGLINLYQRAAKLGGNMNITSGPDGFTVLATIPKERET